jgi:hypothetical protein
VVRHQTHGLRLPRSQSFQDSDCLRARPIRMQMIANEVPTRLESSCSSQAVRYRA